MKPSTISVSGHSSAQVGPDQAVMSMSLVNRDKDLSVAKQANDAMTDRIATIAKQYNIPKDKVATSGFYSSPEYDYSSQNNRQVFRDYMVNRSIRITIDDLTSQEKLLSAIVDAKIDQVNGVEFQLSDREKFAAPLRLKAYEDAKNKAQAIATAAGLKLGPPLTIEVGEATAQPRPYAAMPMMAMAESRAGASVAPSLPGLISIEETVTVTFELQ